MAIYLFAALIGVIAGLRSMTAPAAVSWGAQLGWIKLGASPVSFLGGSIAPYILLVLAIGELIADKLPKTPSRKAPGPFIGRILTGALSGAALASVGGSWIVGAVAGAIGGVIGTLGGAEARGRLAAAFGKDLPAAAIEDAIAITGALAIVHAVGA
jgi:uncharacterized membrane protein